MPTATEVLAKLEKARGEHTRAAQMEAVANNQYEQAQQMAKAAEKQLRDLGVDPANAEAELTAELTRLDQETEAVSQAITERLAEYQQIGTAFQKVNAL
jgi:Tat protein secretion system quality control protein TatD with DNase activity